MLSKQIISTFEMGQCTFCTIHINFGHIYVYKKYSIFKTIICVFTASLCFLCISDKSNVKPISFYQPPINVATLSGTGFNFRIGIRLFVDETAIFIFKTNDDSLLSFFLSSLFFIFILFFSLYNQISRSLSCFEIVFCNCAYSLVDRVHI